MNQIKFLISGPVGSKIVDCTNMSLLKIDKLFRTYNSSNNFKIERVE